jgi:hypothetical protein
MSAAPAPGSALNVNGSSLVSATSTTAFQVNTTGGASLLSADTSDGYVIVGKGATGEAAPDLLILDNGTTSNDPNVVNGGMYYNSSLGQFRCGIGGAWMSCVNGAATTLSSVLGTTATESLGTASNIMVAPLYVPGQITINDFYNSSGTLVVDGGSGSLTTGTGLKTIAPTQTGPTRILPAGQYFVAITGTAAGAVEGGTMNIAGQVRGVENITGGGALLPGTISLGSAGATTIPGISISNGAF